MNIDIHEIINVATKPFGFSKFLPGLGGHCIPIGHFICLEGKKIQYRY